MLTSTNLQRHERMLFALLRASLNQRPAEILYFQEATEEDWSRCYRLAQKQGVMALAWDGVITLPSHLQPPVELKLVWALAVEKYEKKYARYCRTIHELTVLYAKEEIATLQMKGVGLSTYYPTPSHREGGDIDIYTFSADKDGITDEQANHLADELMIQQGIEVEMHSYKHSNFYYQGIPIENHKMFLNAQHHPVIAQADGLLKERMRPRVVNLLDGECRVWIPSSAFNTIFLAVHTLQHYGSGMALHHLCDWAVLINRYGLVLPDELKDPRFLKAVAAMTCLCNRYLGTSITECKCSRSLLASIKVSEGEALADEMLDEILHPKYPHKEVVQIKDKWNILVYKTRKFLHAAKVCNRVFYRPLWKRIWVSVVAHVRRPETIFQTQAG